MKQATSSLHGAKFKDTFSRFIFESEHSLGLGGEGRSLSFRLCQLLVVLLRAVTPFSYLYVFFIWTFRITASHFGSYYPLYYILLAWMSAEVVFLPYHYFLFVTFGNRNKSLEHVAFSSTDRFLLVRQTQTTFFHTSFYPYSMCRQSGVSRPYRWLRRRQEICRLKDTSGR